LVAHGLNIECTSAKSHSDVEAEIIKLLRLESEDVKLHFKDRSPDVESCIAKFVLIQFKFQQDSVSYYQRNKDLKLLHPRQIALLIQP
jgi:hypothetical protein